MDKKRRKNKKRKLPLSEEAPENLELYRTVRKEKMPGVLPLDDLSSRLDYVASNWYNKFLEAAHDRF